eukprot:TRINITY_DN113619_c0_g1_i1.p1 TRINITY_DN113619_c0_g1~~TRINITY_DN113619_c0_g1_i1.p1  ORF type:complete len:194 (+),score=34.78 TRINITY_DN113619_c0_g1_i1:68-649(+)
MVTGPPPRSGNFQYKEGTTLRVTGLGQNVRNTDLQPEFGEFGHVMRIHVLQGKGTAFIEFRDKADAQDAKKYLDGQKVLGTTISVDMAGKGSGKGKDGKDGKDKEDSRNSSGASGQSGRGSASSGGNRRSRSRSRRRETDRRQGRGGRRGSRSRSRGRDNSRGRRERSSGRKAGRSRSSSGGSDDRSSRKRRR